MPHEMSDQMRECIDRCHFCEEVCLESVNHCLRLGGEHAEASHIQTLLACAEMCRSSAHLMSLGSEYHARVCEICAEICDACAEDCDRFDDDTMRRCAETCRRCAESCRQMATAHA